MEIRELIELVENKIKDQAAFIDAVKPISASQQLLCDQARMQYNWFLEKLDILEASTNKKPNYD